MKKIKFRAWGDKYKKMFYLDNKQEEFYKGAFLLWGERIGNYWKLGDADHEWEIFGASNSNDGTESKDVLMQYTGLKDKNGTEIYEGDIVRYIAGENYQTIGVVTWVDEKNSFNFKTYPLVCAFVIHNEKENKTDKFEWDETDYMEVIGNIYESENK
jgi:uncharacterized phage protein (TIGR01671 family)